MNNEQQQQQQQVRQDKIIRCGDCGQDFPFTVKEQEFFASKGYTNDPKRCRNCRRQRKQEQHAADAEDRAFRGAVDEPRAGRR